MGLSGGLADNGAASGPTGATGATGPTGGAGSLTRQGLAQVVGNGAATLFGINFASAFPTACDSVVISGTTGGSLNPYTYQLEITSGLLSASGFGVSTPGGVPPNGGTINFYYIAVGH